MKYYLRNYEHDNNLSLIKFIYLFLTKYNKKYSTIDEDGKFICSTHRLRSLGDITAICQGYYDTNIDEVKEILLSFGSDLVGHYCRTIKKRVYTLKDLYPRYEQCNKGKKDEYGEKITYRTENKNKQYYE